MAHPFPLVALDLTDRQEKLGGLGDENMLA